jgi:inner membrane protein
MSVLSELNDYSIWFSLGLLFLALELLTVGFFFFFLGIGSLLTGLLLLLNIDLSISAQITSAVLISLGSLLALRNPMKKWFNSNKNGGYHDFEGTIIEVSTWNTAHQTGTAIFRGTQWQLKSNSQLSAGQQVKILEVDGITLVVEGV